MGAYSPLPDLDDGAVEVALETVHRPILAEMARRGAPFRGFLYAGLMLTADGPALLEINVRLGDPEGQVILPRVAGAIGPLLLAAASGRIPADAPPRVPVVPGAAVGVVLAAALTGDPRRGDPNEGIDPPRAVGASFPRRTTARPCRPASSGKTWPVLPSWGRSRPGRRRALAEAAADAMRVGGMQRRHDIATTFRSGCRPDPALSRPR